MRRDMMLFIVTGLLLALPAVAQVSRWVDEKGRVQYGDKPPTGKPAQTVVKEKSATQPQPAQKKFVYVPVPRQDPGDPLVARMRDNEERRERERMTLVCAKGGGQDCSRDVVTRMMKEEAEANKKKKPAKKPEPPPIKREPLTPEFCKRHPKVDGCKPTVVLPDK